MAVTSLSQRAPAVQNETATQGTELSPVTFHGDTIFCLDYLGQPYTPMRPIVENMGLSWATQSVKLQSNAKRWSVSMIETVAQDGKRREILCLPVRKLPAYLASINPKKVRAELRERIELYQAESDDALWNYWTRGFASRKPLPLTPFLPAPHYLAPASRRRLVSLVDAKRADVPVHHVWRARMRLWTALNRRFAITQYRHLPEERLQDALVFLSALEIGPRGAIRSTDQQSFPSLSEDAAIRTASALSALIEQARDVLAALPTASHPREVEA